MSGFPSRLLHYVHLKHQTEDGVWAGLTRHPPSAVEETVVPERDEAGVTEADLRADAALALGPCSIHGAVLQLLRSGSSWGFFPIISFSCASSVFFVFTLI